MERLAKPARLESGITWLVVRRESQLNRRIFVSLVRSNNRNNTPEANGQRRRSSGAAQKVEKSCQMPTYKYLFRFARRGIVRCILKFTTLRLGRCEGGVVNLSVKHRKVDFCNHYFAIFTAIPPLLRLCWAAFMKA